MKSLLTFKHFQLCKISLLKHWVSHTMINHIIQIISQDKAFQHQSTTLFYVKIQSPNKHIYTDTKNRDQFTKT